ncbi:MAG: hypothetical protein NC102_01055 [Clostridium sp.]|nr:hypothetical protein [Clostridium sp.]
MASLLLYLGIGLIIIGLIATLYFAFKQMSLEKEYERMPWKQQDMRTTYVRRRFYSRVIMIAGIILLIIFLNLE